MRSTDKRPGGHGDRSLLNETQISDGIYGTRWFRRLGIASVLIAIPTAIISLPPVQDQIFERSPKLAIELTSEIPVLDIQRPMDGLLITFNGSDLNTSRESLVAARIIIRNKGRTGIKANDVSPSDPIGFKIDGGHIVEITGFSANTDHLRRLAKPFRTTNRIVISPTVIIDPGNTLRFDILVRKPRSSKISVLSLGKVADLKSIEVIDARDSAGRESFVERTYSGNFATQIARIISYFFLGLSLVAGFLFVTNTVETAFKKSREKKRRIISHRFIAESSSRNKITDALAASIYYVFGIEGLRFVISKIKSLNVSSQIGKIESTNIKDIIGPKEYQPDFNGFNEFLDSFMTSPSTIERIERHLNLVDNDRVNVQQAYLASLEAMASLVGAADQKGKLGSNHDLVDRRISRRLELSLAESAALTRTAMVSA